MRLSLSPRIVTPFPVKANIIPVGRFAKVGAKAGRQGYLEVRQGINHQPLGTKLSTRQIPFRALPPIVV
jgi:hypothetical protein